MEIRIARRERGERGAEMIRGKRQSEVQAQRPKPPPAGHRCAARKAREARGRSSRALHGRFIPQSASSLPPSGSARPLLRPPSLPFATLRSSSPPLTPLHSPPPPTPSPVPFPRARSIQTDNGLPLPTTRLSSSTLCWSSTPLARARDATRDAPSSACELRFEIASSLRAIGDPRAQPSVGRTPRSLPGSRAGGAVPCSTRPKSSRPRARWASPGSQRTWTNTFESSKFSMQTSVPP